MTPSRSNLSLLRHSFDREASPTAGPTYRFSPDAAGVVSGASSGFATGPAADDTDAAATSTSPFHHLRSPMYGSSYHLASPSPSSHRRSLRDSSPARGGGSGGGGGSVGGGGGGVSGVVGGGGVGFPVDVDDEPRPRAASVSSPFALPRPFYFENAQVNEAAQQRQRRKLQQRTQQQQQQQQPPSKPPQRSALASSTTSLFHPGLRETEAGLATPDFPLAPEFPLGPDFPAAPDSFPLVRRHSAKNAPSSSSSGAVPRRSFGVDLFSASRRNDLAAFYESAGLGVSGSVTGGGGGGGAASFFNSSFIRSSRRSLKKRASDLLFSNNDNGGGGGGSGRRRLGERGVGGGGGGVFGAGCFGGGADFLNYAEKASTLGPATTTMTMMTTSMMMTSASASHRRYMPLTVTQRLPRPLSSVSLRSSASAAGQAQPSTQQQKLLPSRLQYQQQPQHSQQTTPSHHNQQHQQQQQQQQQPPLHHYHHHPRQPTDILMRSPMSGGASVLPVQAPRHQQSLQSYFPPPSEARAPECSVDDLSAYFSAEMMGEAVGRRDRPVVISRCSVRRRRQETAKAVDGGES